ncbi:MAG: hypothetical protein IPM54_14425 [Polyangiaceae bacterium]|nr:hypothetical protein [Polyangiaceae bacterium]
MAVLGIPPDRFLAMVRAPGFPLRVASVGKLRIVKTEDVIAYLDRIGETPSALGNKEATSNDNAEPPIENEDDAARKLGSALGFTFSDDPPASGRRRKG